MSVHRTKDIESSLWLSTPRANEIPRSENFVKGRTPSPSEYAEIMNKKILLTPTTREEVQDLEKFKARMEKYPNGTTMPNLATQIVGMLPTPMASEGGKMSGSPTENQMSLTKMVRQNMFQTPRASDKNMHWKTENWKGDDLGSQVNEIFGTRSHLSPLFVEEMMGFPENWTALPFQSGDKSQSKHTVTQ